MSSIRDGHERAQWEDLLRVYRGNWGAARLAWKFNTGKEPPVPRPMHETPASSASDPFDLDDESVAPSPATRRTEIRLRVLGRIPSVNHVYATVIRQNAEGASIPVRIMKERGKQYKAKVVEVLTRQLASAGYRPNPNIIYKVTIFAFDSWFTKAASVRKADVTVSRNYLDAQEP